MTAELRERVARLEVEVADLPRLRERISSLERFKIMVTTLWAATIGLAGVFGETIKKKFGL